MQNSEAKPGTLDVTLEIGEARGTQLFYVIDGKQTEVPITDARQQIKLDGLPLGPTDVEVKIVRDGKTVYTETIRTKDVLDLTNPSGYAKFLEDEGEDLEAARIRAAKFMVRRIDSEIASLAARINELNLQKPVIPTKQAVEREEL